MNKALTGYNNLIFDDDTLIGYAGDIKAWLVTEIGNVATLASGTQAMDELWLNVNESLSDLLDYIKLAVEIDNNYDDRAILKVNPNVMGHFEIKVLDE